MIGLVSVAGETVLIQTTGMTGAHDAVFQRQVLECEGLQQWIIATG